MGASKVTNSDHSVSVQHVIILVFLTIFWGLNWPVMKMAINQYPPMTFRGLSIIVGLLGIASFMKWKAIPFSAPRKDWVLLIRLGVINMVVWHVVLMFTLPHLNSGRAAVIAYTMPVFSALWGVGLYKQQIAKTHAACILVAFIGIFLLLWTELSSISGAPAAALTLLLAVSVWALGAQQLRRSSVQLNIITISFWMTAVTAVVVIVLAVILESEQWKAPSIAVNWAIIYNGIIVFAFCHTAWAYLARTLNPVVSSVSISLIPVIGLLSGAYFLNEDLSWLDALAILLIGSATLVTLMPRRAESS